MITNRFFEFLGDHKPRSNVLPLTRQLIEQLTRPWILCGVMGFLLAVCLVMFIHVHRYYETQISYLSKAQQAYSEGLQLQENKKKWQNVKEQNQDSWARLSKIEKMKTMTPKKIVYLLERLAKSHGFTNITVYCEPSAPTQLEEQGGALGIFSCKIKGNTLIDKTAFQFINFLTAYMPPTPCIATAKIKRLEPLTPVLLGQIAAKKPAALFSVCLTVEWLFMKDVS